MEDSLKDSLKGVILRPSYVNPEEVEYFIMKKMLGAVEAPIDSSAFNHVFIEVGLKSGKNFKFSGEQAIEIYKEIQAYAECKSSLLAQSAYKHPIPITENWETGV